MIVQYTLLCLSGWCPENTKKQSSLLSYSHETAQLHDKRYRLDFKTVTHKKNLVIHHRLGSSLLWNFWGEIKRQQKQQCKRVLAGCQMLWEVWCEALLPTAAAGKIKSLLSTARPPARFIWRCITVAVVAMSLRAFYDRTLIVEALFYTESYFRIQYVLLSNKCILWRKLNKCCLKADCCFPDFCRHEFVTAAHDTITSVQIVYRHKSIHRGEHSFVCSNGSISESSAKPAGAPGLSKVWPQVPPLTKQLLPRSLWPPLKRVWTHLVNTVGFFWGAKYVKVQISPKITWMTVKH